MKIYAIIGSSAETIDQTSKPVTPPDHIEMTERRVTPDHVAQADGTWALPVPTSAEVLAEAEAKRAALLSSTDWYYMRETKTGQPVPENVKAFDAAVRALENDPAWPDVNWPVLSEPPVAL